MQTIEEVKDTPDTPCSLPDPSCLERKGISQEYAIITQKLDAELQEVYADPLYGQLDECVMDLMCNESSADGTDFLEYDVTDLESENMSIDLKENHLKTLNENQSPPESENMSEDEMENRSQNQNGNQSSPKIKLKDTEKSLFSHTPTSIDVFSLLSDEVILQIFKFLPRWFLINCALVCKRWNKLSCDMSLWWKYDMAERVVKSGDLENLLSRGVVVLRLARSEIRYPIFCPDFLNNPRLSALQYLDLSMATVSPVGLAEILHVCVNLKKLSLESCEVNEDCLRNISNNKKLSVLNLTMCTGITGSGLLPIFIKCIKLAELNLAWIKLNFVDWVPILPFIPQSIQRLNVSGHKVTFNDKCLLQVVNRCRNLTELDFSDCRNISRNSFEELIKNCKELEHLHASRCFHIPSISYRLLKSLPKFRCLDIFNTLNDGALISLREYLPHVSFNKNLFSTIARPTTGSQRFSIWGIPTKDDID